MGVGWSTPRPGRFTPGNRLGTHCIGGWLEPRAVLDGCGKSLSNQDSIPAPPARSSHYTGVTLSFGKCSRRFEGLKCFGNFGNYLSNEQTRRSKTLDTFCVHCVYLWLKLRVFE